MPKEIRSADELVNRILSDPKTWAKVQEDPATELRKLAQTVGNDVPVGPALENDTIIYRMVVAIIGIVAVLAVMGAIWAVKTTTATENATALLTAMVSISSAAIGALAGLLSPMGFRR